MARIIIDATIDPSSVHPGATVDSTTGGVGVLLSITHEDGRTYTGLKEKNFKTQLILYSFEAVASLLDLFFEKAKDNKGITIQGIYSFVIFLPEKKFWSPNTYNLIIQVQQGPDHGQTVKPFHIKQEQIGR